MTRVDFPDPGHPGDAGHQADRNLHVDTGKVVAPGADDADQPQRIEPGALARHLDDAPAREVLPGQRCGIRRDRGRRTFGDDSAAVHARARSHVDDVIGAVDRLLVVLDHDDGVADVAQVLERVEEAAVVALMQSDRGLVEDVGHPDQPRADLAREPDALGLPAGERLRGAVEGEVVEPHVVEELQALGDFPEHALRDLGPGSAKSDPGEEVTCGADRQRGEVGQRLAADEDVARGPVEPGPAARLARAGAEVLRELVADHARLRLPVPALHVGDHALEGMGAGVVAAPLGAEREPDGLGAAPVQDHVAHLGGEVAEGGVDVEAVVRGERPDHLEVVEVAPVPAPDRAAG